MNLDHKEKSDSDRCMALWTKYIPGPSALFWLPVFPLDGETKKWCIILSLSMLLFLCSVEKVENVEVGTIEVDDHG